MSKIFSKRNMIVLGVIIVIGIVWYFVSGTSSPDAIDIISSTPAQSESNSLLNTLNQIKSLTLNDSIFSNPLFQGLTDFSVPLMPEASGRPDPFAPLPPFAPNQSTLSLTTATTTSP